ncbi:MAG: ATP-binding protein [Acetobacteraceae bacterium]|nr:ATP-binding protein [Acetobacteraceae bacterium]
MVVILLAGLMVSYLVGTWINASDRAQAARAIGGYAATQRIANLARLIDEAPEAWRDRIVAAASDPTLRVSLSSSQPPATVGETPDAADLLIRDYLAEQLPAAMAARLYVAVSGATGQQFARPGHPMPMMGPWMHRAVGWRSLQAAIQLSDGQWLTFLAALPNTGPSISWQFTIAMAIMALIVVLASVWAVRRVTAPLGVLARAAERLGRDVNAPPVAEAGTREMRLAAHSFNEMQGRLQRLLENRTRMLAALSHDLRTPLTLLRLRTEGLHEGDERDRMLATIGELDAMIEATLKFARNEATAEPWRRTDMAALLASAVDDMADAGLPVTMEAAEPVVLECQPAALRRAISNLLDNAIKYGRSAHTRIATSPAAISIVIDDEGPGIPDADLRRVFEPFYRLEQSRSRETGGTGLGLSIALSVVQAHGGQITLINRPEGGLRATLSLPR